MASHAKKFRKHLSEIPLDIRQLGAALAYNQKVTPDIVASVADVVSRIVNRGKKKFTVMSVRDSDEFKQWTESVLTKPDPANPKLRSEYDKLARHPLQALSYSGILREESSRPVAYTVASWRMLKYIAGEEGAAAEFLAELAEGIFRESGLGRDMDRFFEKQDDRSLRQLKEAYIRLVNNHTGVRKAKEPRRMFPKMLNIMACARQSHGIVRGRLSPNPITWEDVRYNRANWRDMKKTCPSLQSLPPLFGGKKGEIVGIANAKREVKEFHRGRPEIAGALSESGGVEAHHIFPRSAHPEFAAKRENIILLSSSQHRQFAHPTDKESISKGYQLLCLLRKLDAVVESECKVDCDFYRFSIFVEMLVSCGKLRAKEKRVIFQKPFPGGNSMENPQIIRHAADDLRRFLIRRCVEEN